MSSAATSLATAPETHYLEDRASAAEARMGIHLREKNGAAKALDAAIETLELLMEAQAQAPTQDQKLRLNAKLKQLMLRAEEIKKVQKQQAQEAVAEGVKKTKEEIERFSLSKLEQDTFMPVKKISPALKAPRSNRLLSVHEQIIVLQSSKVAGLKFPPWTSDALLSEFSSTELFTDAIGMLPLSDAQARVLDSWRRATEISEEISMKQEEPMDLAQDAITDCSIVASMCAAVSSEERGHAKIVSNIIYPQDQNGNPKVSASGKYLVKMYFNGCHRKVVIDDYLPKSTHRALHVVCRSNPQLIWPALVEKAYLKVMGGYDFPGSNSGTDLLALTGWIPEHVFLQSDIDPSSLWRRIHKAWGYGDILITLGTGIMAHHEEEELGLASEHDYAVLDLKEIDGRRLMLIKNPWSEGAVWRGGLDHLDSDSEEDVDTTDNNKEPEEWTEWDESMALPAPTGPGQFWMDLGHICRYFANMYLNWNPGLFRFRFDHHFTWDLQENSGKMCKASFSRNPQFSIVNPSRVKSATVWLLLQRHLHGEPMPPGCPRAGYISLYVFEKDGKKAYLSDGALIRGPYVDSPQTLLRLDSVPPETIYTVVISSQDLSAEQHSFTLSVFSDSPLKTGAVSDIYPFRHSVTHAWHLQNAGGNAQSPTYSINPQFKLTIPPSTADTGADILLLLESRNELSIHVKLVWGGGRRVTTVTNKDIIAESGEYRRGCALAEKRGLEPGDYTIVASTFERGQVGDFVLTVIGSEDIGLEIIRAETAGKFVRTVTGAWPITMITKNEQSLYQQCTILAFQISAPRLTRISLVAITIPHRHQEQHHAPPLLRISLQRHIYPVYLSSLRSPPPPPSLSHPPSHLLPLPPPPPPPLPLPHVRVLSTSGPGWNDVPQGVRAEEVDIEGSNTLSGMWQYWGVLERMEGGGGSGEDYEVVVLADGVVLVGEGVAVEGKEWIGVEDVRT